MRAKLEAVFLGINENEFKDAKTGELVRYRRATFNVRDTPETFVLGVPSDLDTKLLKQYSDSYLLVDFRFNSNNNTFKGRLVDIYPDSKAMASSPLFTADEQVTF